MQTPDILLEVCVDSLDSARSAVNYGANRLEVCGCIGVGGGITPTLGLVRLIKTEFPSVPLHVMIRPRIGSFVYTADEIAVMKQDIIEFKNMCVEGVVTGALTPDGCVDTVVTSQLAELAVPLAVTFHRAFDIVRDIEQALEDIATIPGVTRVLTSGGAIKAPSAVEQLKRLFLRSNEISRVQDKRLSILVGSGLNARTLPSLLDSLIRPPYNLNEIHCSCGDWVNVQSHSNEVDADAGAREGAFAFGFGAHGPAETRVWKTLPERVAAVVHVIQGYSTS